MIGRGHRGRVDRNQAEIVKALRQAGCSVQSLAKVGDGCPDLLVARGESMWLLEVKDKVRSPRRKMTPPEVKEADWAARWPTPVHTVYNFVEALAIVGIRGVREAAGN